MSCVVQYNEMQAIKHEEQQMQCKVIVICLDLDETKPTYAKHDNQNGLSEIKPPM